MSRPSKARSNARVRPTAQLSVAAVFALAQISRWGLFAWKPRHDTRAAMAILANPKRTSLNPRTVTILLDAGMIDVVGDGLVVTDAGRHTVAAHTDLAPVSEFETESESVSVSETHNDS